jgi:hypothetical protein
LAYWTFLAGKRRLIVSLQYFGGMQPAKHARAAAQYARKRQAFPLRVKWNKKYHNISADFSRLIALKRGNGWDIAFLGLDVANFDSKILNLWIFFFFWKTYSFNMFQRIAHKNIMCY